MTRGQFCQQYALSPTTHVCIHSQRSDTHFEDEGEVLTILTKMKRHLQAHQRMTLSQVLELCMAKGSKTWTVRTVQLFLSVIVQAGAQRSAVALPICFATA